MLTIANAKHMPLAESFTESVCGHASMFQSCGESEEEDGLFAHPPNFTLFTLDSDYLTQITHLSSSRMVSGSGAEHWSLCQCPMDIPG